MKNMILAVIFTAAPAAAQTTVRVPVSGVNGIPSLGVTPVPTMMLPPALSPGLQAPALSALALTPTLVPASVQPALAVSIHAASAKPVEGSPLGVIRDASSNEAQKTAALNQLFENSALTSHETPTVTAGNIGPFPATEYTNLKTAIKARGVKAGLAMQASRTRREGRYWFTVDILGTEDDFNTIEDLFKKDPEGWSYAGIHTDIQLRGIPVDPAAPPKAAALAAQGPNEFSQAPAWFDASKLKFDALIKSGTSGTAVLRYGWRDQYEMSVFAFPGNPSVSFKEYSSNPMGHPKQSFDATLETAAARKATAKILRAAQMRNPVTGNDKITLDAILAFLEEA